MTLVPRNVGASKLAQSNHFAEQSGSELPHSKRARSLPEERAGQAADPQEQGSALLLLRWNRHERLLTLEVMHWPERQRAVRIELLPAGPGNRITDCLHF